jgi:hypothetical protein
MFLWQDGEVTKLIKSDVKQQLRRSGDPPAGEPFEAQSASRREGEGFYLAAAPTNAYGVNTP